MSVVIETTKGAFTVDLYVEQRPKICKNFLKLCKVKFYNLNLFHCVQTNFIAQTGSGVGSSDTDVSARSGESIYRSLYGDQATYFEGDMAPKIKHTKSGQISMVTVGDNMFGSQFFITLEENLDYLDGQGHTVFGEIVEGSEEIIQAFNETICDGDQRPYQDIRITHMVVLEDPFEDPPGMEVPPASPEPTKELLASSRIGADEDLNDYEGLDEEQITELHAEKEAKAQATILEMIGDLPDADCAPPENVLFVCKLNPVTTDDDLEIIFSRFGRVVSCEVIRDHKTGDSLQYAFVEFEDQKACEAAYFKMDNVLIDDRRIHVDFSQSVSKYRWKGKGRLEVIDDGPKAKKNHDNKPAPRRSRSRDRIVPKRRHSPPRDTRKESVRGSRSRDRKDERDRKENVRRSRSRDRKDERRRRSRSRDRDDGRSKDRKDRKDRSGSRDRKKDRKRSRSRDNRKRSRSRDHKRRHQNSRSRSRDRDRSKNSDRHRHHHKR